MVKEPMQGKLASSQFDLGHSDVFCIPEVTSGFFSSCDMKDEPALKALHEKPAFF